MTTWAIIVEETEGFGAQNKRWSSRLMGHVDGTHGQGMEALRREALKYDPEHLYRKRRRRLYRHNDGYMLLVDGTTGSSHCRFSLAELVHDTAKVLSWSGTPRARRSGRWPCPPTRGWPSPRTQRTQASAAAGLDPVFEGAADFNLELIASRRPRAHLPAHPA